MSETQCTEQLELFEVGRQQVTMTFDGGQVVSDAGLLPIRELDLKLGILAEAARRMPDPRSEKALTHSAEDILTQQVYQILAGYPDGNDAQLLRNDPLFKSSSAKIRVVKMNRSPADPPSIDFSMRSHDAKPRNPSKNATSFSKCDAIRSNASTR